MNVSAAGILPHQPPLRFIDTLTYSDGTCARAIAQFAVGHFAVSDGRVLEAALVECVAQTVAAALGYNASGKAAPGMLAAVNEFQIHARPPAGATLEIETRELKRLGPMRLIAGTITCDGTPVAAGEITVYA